MTQVLHTLENQPTESATASAPSLRALLAYTETLRHA